MIMLEALWFFLPAGAANVMPILAKNIKMMEFLNIPLDFGKEYKGKRIFGDHKTIRGFVSGFMAALFILLLQLNLYVNFEFVQSIALFDYTNYSITLLAFLFSFGALGGDTIKSFFKRRSGVLPGQTWVPFDQIDYIIGGLLAVSTVISLGIAHYIMIFIIWAVIHPISTLIGFWLKLKDSPI